MEDKRRRTRANESLINILRGMKYRCYYSTLPKHVRNYRGKGITICQEWWDDAATFDRWALASGWAPGLTIDRIDGDGNYEPANCQFITHAENNRKSANAKLTHADVAAIRKRYCKGTNSSEVLALQYGVSPRTIQNVCNGPGWR